MKITIGTKISSGFGALLAILVLTSAYSIFQMKTAATGSFHVSEEYIPELDLTDRLQSSVDMANLNARSFGLTSDNAYLELCRKALLGVDAAPKDAEGLATRSTQLHKLKETIAGGRALYNNYVSLIDETAKSDVELDALRDQAAKSSSVAAKGFDEVLSREFERLDAEIAGAASADVLRERRTQISVLSHVREQLLETGIANFRSQAERQPQLLRDALNEYGKISGEIDQLGVLMRKSEDVKALTEIKRETEDYRTILTTLVANAERSIEIGKGRTKSAEALQAFSSELTEAAQSSAGSISHEASLSLASAANITIGCLIAALVVGIIIALWITRMITGPVLRATASVEKVASGDLTENDSRDLAG